MGTRRQLAYICTLVGMSKRLSSTGMLGQLDLFFSMQSQNFFTIPLHVVSPVGGEDFLHGRSAPKRTKAEAVLPSFKSQVLNWHSSISPFFQLKEVTVPDHVHRENTRAWIPGGEVYQWQSWKPTTTGDYYPCSPAVPSRLVAEAVDGAVALDSIFSGLLYCRYKFTICIYFFPVRF